MVWEYSSETKTLNKLGGMLPDFVVLGIWCEDNIDNYSGCGVMRKCVISQALWKRLRGREERNWEKVSEREKKKSGTISIRLCYQLVWCISEIHTKLNWDTLLYKHSKFDQNLALRRPICYTWKKWHLYTCQCTEFILGYINHLDTLLLCKEPLFSVMLMNNHIFSWGIFHLK